jgi:hypothetical protein
VMAKEQTDIGVLRAGYNWSIKEVKLCVLEEYKMMLVSMLTNLKKVVPNGICNISL